MKDLTQSLREIAGILESLSARYAVMGASCLLVTSRRGSVAGR
jgi:hypothetical protein